MKKTILLILIILLLVSCSNNSYQVLTENSNTEIVEKKILLIDLKGEVKYPNIYEVKEGTTIYELIILAGGFTNNANTDTINLVSILKENQMIIIPSKQITTQDNQNYQDNLVNINKANLEQLLTLPGIGTSKAQNIINYRNNGGYFNSIEDIKKVSGIGEELFTKIKDYICV